jgi:diacylglycerol kinase family enzyme
VRASADGPPPRHPKVVYVPGVVAATLTARGRVPYQMDGEPLGAVPELAFAWEPDNLRLVVPGGEMTTALRALEN